MIKRGEFDYSVIFAIIVGALFLFFAIKGAMNFGKTANLEKDTFSSKQLSILIDPMQAGFSDLSYGKISFREETRINNFCDDFSFGKNVISIQTKDMRGKWSAKGGDNPVKNKYIFSKEKEEGKDFFVFSNSFKLSYKVADVVFLTSNYYCFLNAPDEVKEDILGLGFENLFIEDKQNNKSCKEGSIRVCFGSTKGCDITIYGLCNNFCEKGIYTYGKVVKSDGEVYYVWPLLYGSIFSSKSNYECNVKRLFYRAYSISKILKEKSLLMSMRGCGSNLEDDLDYFGLALVNSTQRELIDIYEIANALDKKNRGVDCSLWD